MYVVDNSNNEVASENLVNGVHLPTTLKIVKKVLSILPLQVEMTKTELAKYGDFTLYQYHTTISLPVEESIKLEILEMPDEDDNRATLKLQTTLTNTEHRVESLDEAYQIIIDFINIAFAQYNILKVHTHHLDTIDTNEDQLARKLATIYQLAETLEADYKQGFYTSASKIGVQFNSQSGYYLYTED